MSTITTKDGRILEMGAYDDLMDRRGVLFELVRQKMKPN